MELERYEQLRALLQQWRRQLAESIRQRIENSPHYLRRLQTTHTQEGVDEAFTLWLDRWCRQAAIQFILRTLFLRVLEDRGLLGIVRLRTEDGQQIFRQLTHHLGAASYVQYCFWDAAHLLPDLFGPNEYDLVPPEDTLVSRFFDQVWRRPDHSGDGLRFDFRPDHTGGFQTRFIGDLYQELDAEIRERYALLQTPHFISQFILEHTLLKRFEEKDFREVTLIDPTCGSGHFLIDAFWHFVKWYQEAGDYPDTQEGRAALARHIIETHIFGADINPYATALTRFRLLLAACDFSGVSNLNAFRDLHFNIVTIDSLIPYEKQSLLRDMQGGAQMGRLFGQPETIKQALPVLSRRYDVVVGNPPYILERDAHKRELYRQHHTAASGKFNLSAPFTERFIDLSDEEGQIGILESNAFAQRIFGRKLIEEVLPEFDLEAVIDLSGAYLPGHGTPTLILFLVNRRPSANSAQVIINRKAEPSTPDVPSEGKVWTSIANHYDQLDYSNEFIVVTEYPREELSEHPWNLSPNRQLLKKIELASTIEMKTASSYLGPGCLTGEDEIYLLNEDQARRERIGPDVLKWALRGEDIRDWVLYTRTLMLVPYEKPNNGNLLLVDLKQGALTYLSRFHNLLAHRSPLPAGRKWYELCRSAGAEGLNTNTVGYAYLATHNHFALNPGHAVYQRSGYSLTLTSELESQQSYLFITGILNTSLAALYLKSVSFDRRAGRDPVRDTYYDFASSNVGKVPVPSSADLDGYVHQHFVDLVADINELASQLPSIGTRKLFEKPNEAYYRYSQQIQGFRLPNPNLLPFQTAHELAFARDYAVELRRDTRQSMIFFQEEMDWLAYEMYGLISRAPLARDYLTPTEFKNARLELGQRAFEQAGKGYKGDWPKTWKRGAKGHLPGSAAELPALSDNLQRLTADRVRLIESNKDIALLEDPLYKRRWIPDDYEAEFRQAAAWWLAEKLEYALEQHGKPITLRHWARLMERDERVMATLEVLTGSRAFDVQEEIAKVIAANAVPNRPEHYLKLSGLRKLHVEGAAFARADFADGTAWQLRGKLNIPRERFIYYREFDDRSSEAPSSGGPWYGWAGWDADERADALAFLLQKAMEAGWALHYQQCGLRAALRGLLQRGQLDHLSEIHRAEFEGLATMCGLSLDTYCYCREYKEGIVEGQPGVPGVAPELLQVKVIQGAEAKQKESGKSKKQKDKGSQLTFDF